MQTVNKPALVRCQSCSTINRIDLSRVADGPKCARCGKSLPVNRPQAVTDADFQRIVNGASVPVLVDFHADWCGPCKAMAPTLAAFASRRAGEVLVCQLDTDANPLTAARYGIRSIPTILLVKGGKVADQVIGAVPRAKLQAKLDALA